MAENHDFDDTVVAVLDSREAADVVVDCLATSGYDYELLEGEQGKAHLDPARDSGAGATLKRLLKVFGDQHRVLDHLNQQLDDGKVVISIDAGPEEADGAAKVLQDNGGEFIWKFGTWTYTRAGD